MKGSVDRFLVFYNDAGIIVDIIGIDASFFCLDGQIIARKGFIFQFSQKGYALVSDIRNDMELHQITCILVVHFFYRLVTVTV